MPVRREGEEQEFEIAPGVWIVMCWIPPGEFLMGSPEDEIGRLDNETQHQISIAQGFWLGKHPVTQLQWEAVMGHNPSFFKGSSLPVECVGWNQIVGIGGFIEKINCLHALEDVFFLPNEAQWEYACMAGTQTALNSGEDLTTIDGFCPKLDEVAWYKGNSGNSTHPVGLKKANAWGLHDMHGNVCEWCLDWHGDYESIVKMNPFRLDSIPYRPHRGGSWGYDAFSCRASYRGYGATITGAGYFFGFRLARSAAASTVSRSNERNDAEQVRHNIQIKTSNTSGRLHRIGEYELHRPDYQLVCFWAEQLNISPAAVLVALFKPMLTRTGKFQTTLIDGRFVNMLLGPWLKGIKGLPSIEGLRIKSLMAIDSNFKEKK
jgi:formylglycine-generating enzyme required for sulfatase activity